MPGQQRRVRSQQLLQRFDIVVVNDASSLCNRPLESLAKPLGDLGCEVLPAGKTILTRDDELRIALRQRWLDARQMRPRPCDCIGVAARDVTRELLCLFAEGIERRTSRERLRQGHGSLLS
jgi:hypothetical protein